MFDFLKNLLKTSNESQIKKLQKTVDQINALEAQTKQLSDDQMREKIAALRQRAQAGLEGVGMFHLHHVPVLQQQLGNTRLQCRRVAIDAGQQRQR